MRRIGLTGFFAVMLLVAVDAPGANAQWGGGSGTVHVTFQVVNTSGVPQSRASVEEYGAAADNNGRIELNAYSGETVHITRGASGMAQGDCGWAPEGSGVAYTVPGTAPSSPVKITLPTLDLPTTAPALSDEERWFVGQVNLERAKRGARPLEISTTLAQAADGYSGYLDRTGKDGHCAYGDSGLRTTDRGWPAGGSSWLDDDGVREVLCFMDGGAITAPEALTCWKSSSTHWADLMDPSHAAIGVGIVQGVATAELARPCAAGAAGRCGMTGDHGDPNIKLDGDRADSPSEGPGSDLRRPRLRIVRYGVRAGKLRVSLRTRAGANGRLTARTARKGTRYRTRVRSLSDGRFKLASKLGGGGVYRLMMRFDGHDGWRDKRLCRRVVLRTDGGVRLRRC